MSWEPKLPKEVGQEVPLNRVKCFLEINFQQTTGGGALPTILLKKLLDKVDVITHVSAT
jgi:hypothetical protein